MLLAAAATATATAVDFELHSKYQYYGHCFSLFAAVTSTGEKYRGKFGRNLVDLDEMNVMLVFRGIKQSGL